MKNDAYYAELENATGEDTREVHYENEIGFHTYDAEIEDVVTEFSKEDAEKKFIRVKIIAVLKSGQIIEPEITWRMLDNRIPVGKDSSPREMNHKIAWGRMSKWLRALTGISFSSFKGNKQKAFKVAIFDGRFGQKCKINLVAAKETVEVEVPEIRGLWARFELEVEDSGTFNDKYNRNNVFRNWDIIERIDRPELENLEDINSSHLPVEELVKDEIIDDDDDDAPFQVDDDVDYSS